MRTTTRMLAGAATFALALGGAAYVATADAPGTTAATGTTGAAVQVDDSTAEGIAFMREEERLARDLYTALDAHYDGLAPFSNIKLSEQRHFDAVGRLLTTHQLSDPSAGKEAGEYADADLQKLYDDWLERGLTSQAEAFTVGAELEAADIADLEQMIDEVDDAQVDRVLGNLLNGSRHHLAAFEAAADGQTVGQVDAQCDGECDGSGMRQGQGQQQDQQQGKGMQQGRGGGPGQQQGPRQGMGSGMHRSHGQGQGHGPGDGSCDGSCDGQGDGSGECRYDTAPTG